MEPVVLDGRFRLKLILGRGAAGEVYRARDLAKGQDVAIKRLLTRDRAARRRLLREYLAMRRISHPHIVRAFDWGLGGDYFSMELVLGETIDRFAERSSTDAFREVLRDVLHAIATIHAHGLVHLDITPANILVVEEPRPSARIIDFGLQRSLGARIRQATGTPAYTAPEVLRGTGPIDGRADLYSLGVILVEALGGARVGGDGSAISLLARRARLRSIAEKLDAIEPSLRRLVAHLIAEDPDDRPISALDAQELLDGREPRGLWPLVKPKLIERSEALAEVEERVDAALGGMGGAHVVRIGGEPGIGKSRLLDRLEIRFRSRGIATVRGAWAEDSTSPIDAFQPLLSEVARRLRLEAGDRGSTPLSANRPIDGLADFLLSALGGLGGPGIVAFLEDSHWAGAIGSRLIEELATRLQLAQVPLALIVTHRPDRELEAPSRGTADIRLGPLEQMSVERMAAGMLGARRLLPESSRALFEASAGNPLAVTEIVRSLALSGVVGHRDGTAYVKRPIESVWNADTKSAGGLEAAVRQRMRLLSDGARDLVGKAAVLGPRIRYDLLSAVSELEDEAVLDHLDEAFRLRVMERCPGAGNAVLRFNHERVRDLTAAALERGTRRGYQTKAAQVLLAFDNDDLRAEAGVQLFRAGSVREALPHLLFGADRSSNASNLPQAIELYRMALRCEERSSDQAKTRLALGELLRQVGHPEEAKEELLEGLEDVLPAAGSKALLNGGDLDGITGERASTVARFLSALGSVHLHMGDLSGARQRYRNALALQTRAGKGAETRATKMNLGIALGGAGDIPAAIELLEEALADSDEQDRLRALALTNLGHFLNLSGHGGRAVETYREALDVARSRSDDSTAAAVLGNLGEVLQGLGRLHEALDHHERSLEIRERIGDTVGRLHALNGIGEALVGLGRCREARETLDRSERLAKGAGSLAQMGDALLCLGEAQICASEYEEARRHLDSALVAHRRVGEPGPIALTLKALGAMAISAGDLREAETLLFEAAEVARAVERPRIDASVRYHRARIDAFRGNFEASRSGFEGALSVFQRIGNRRGEVRASLALAELDHAEGSPREERSARAIEIARRYGGKALLAEARIGRSVWLAGVGKLAAAEREVCIAIEELAHRPAQQAVARAQLGAVSAARGRINRAERELAVATRTLGRLGRRLEEGRALLSWSEIEYGLGDDESGAEHHGRALAIFKGIGALALADRARELERTR